MEKSTITERKVKTISWIVMFAMLCCFGLSGVSASHSGYGENWMKVNTLLQDDITQSTQPGFISPSHRGYGENWMEVNSVLQDDSTQ